MQPELVGQIPRFARTLLSQLLDQEASVEGEAQTIGPSDRAMGKVTSVRWSAGSVSISGYHSGEKITFDVQGIPLHETVHPTFSVSLSRPDAQAPIAITCQTDDLCETLYLPTPSSSAVRRARRRALPRALRRVLAESRSIFSFLQSGDPNISLGIRQRLNLTDRREGVYLPNGLFGSETVPTPEHPPAIVVPVFNGLDDLQNLLDRLPETTGCPCHLVLVNDGSDDPAVAAELARFEVNHPDLCTLLSLEENQGFVAAANAGIRAAMELTQGDIILLNSDALPPENWVPRLLAPIQEDRSVASVTPMSNAAEILSVPMPGSFDMPSVAAVDHIDIVAGQLSKSIARAEIPTGVGFCISLNRRFLDRLGVFDPSFGRGYGEEVDWCQRARKSGGRNLGLASLFVGHRGGASFGSEEKATRIAAASREISRRYPNYDKTVQDWCRTDPMASARLALSIAWLGAHSGWTIPVFFGHSLGGGAEAALNAEIATHLKAGCPGVVILRVGGPLPWRIEVRTEDANHLGEVPNQGLIAQLLAPLGRRRFIYSCGVGAAEPAKVPRFLLQLVQPGTEFEMRLHDYFPISPSWNLLNSQGRFKGVPDEGTRDAAHRVDGCNPLDHRDWRLLWRAVIRRAETITVFSRSSAEIFATAYPEAKQKIKLQPHQPAAMPEQLAPGGTNIGVLGSINKAKGGEVLVGLASCIGHRRIIVFGQLDGQYRLPLPHAVHGGYKQAEIARLARRYDIGLWLIPSVCPETFSFATHEALATGLPVLSFDLGAQSEALKTASNGQVLPYDPDDSRTLASRIEELLAAHSDKTFRSAS